MLKNPALLITALLVGANASALSPMAEEGKVLFAVCHACHNPDLDPPKGAPMFGLYLKYSPL